MRPWLRYALYTECHSSWFFDGYTADLPFARWNNAILACDNAWRVYIAGELNRTLSLSLSLSLNREIGSQMFIRSLQTTLHETYSALLPTQLPIPTRTRNNSILLQCGLRREDLARRIGASVLARVTPAPLGHAISTSSITARIASTDIVKHCCGRKGVVATTIPLLFDRRSTSIWLDHARYDHSTAYDTPVSP